uniref:hypothetical protein n=1 Tax=Accumulibacter sp. TaxID=2053492 RepID=UPI00258F6231
RIEALLGAVAGADEGRQPAQLQKLAHHPNSGTTLQGDAEVRRQSRWGRADRNRFASLLQGTACQAEVGGYLPLRLSRRQARAGRLKLFSPLQARAALHDPPTIDHRAAHSGTGLVSGL